MDIFPDLSRGGIEFYRLEVYMILGALFKEKNTSMFYFCKFYKPLIPAFHLIYEETELDSQKTCLWVQDLPSGHLRVEGL